MDKSDELLVVWSNAPDEKTAEGLARVLVEEKLAACVHIFPQGTSFYAWEGEVQKATEWTMMVKTSRSAYPLLEQRLHRIHPYDVPEIVATPVADGLPAYLEWVWNFTVAVKRNDAGV